LKIKLNKKKLGKRERQKTGANGGPSPSENQYCPRKANGGIDTEKKKKEKRKRTLISHNSARREDCRKQPF